MTDHATKTASSARLCGNRCRSGFTLVEVLVVTVMIGILIALVSTAIFPALQNAKEFAITSEAGQLGMAIEAFKSHYGVGYPPADLTEPASGGVDLLYNFVRETFPRFQYDPSSVDPANPDPLTATNLRTYLQNLKNEDGDVKGFTSPRSIRGRRSSSGSSVLATIRPILSMATSRGCGARIWKKRSTHSTQAASDRVMKMESGPSTTIPKPYKV